MKKFSAITIFILLRLSVNAQDIHFSQFYMAPLQLNPALAGAQHDAQFLLNYKDQWQSIGSPYKTAAFSYDMRLNRHSGKKNILAAGVNFFSDKAGDAKMGTTQAMITLAYHARIGDNSTFGGAVTGGFAQHSIDYSGLQWGNQYDGSQFNAGFATGEPSATTNFSYADFGGGLLYNYDNNLQSKNQVISNHDLKLNFGIACFHLNRPEYSYYGNTDERLYMKYVVHGNALVSFSSSNLALAPGFMYYRQGATQEIYCGTLLRYTIRQDSKYTNFKQGAAVSAGAFLRAKDAVAATVLIEYARYALGLSYDVNVSRLESASLHRGGLEISLRFVTPNPFTSARSSSFFN
jgi:type IX secretion system PorP/SprF family membrane protein